MIETEVEGSPAAVRAAASWLRGTLAANVAKAGDEQAEARQAASQGWEGRGGSAYQEFTGHVVRATDNHAPRVRRAATACDAYADRLEQAQHDMAALRTRAGDGGLTVAGTVIEAPPSVPPSVVVPGSPEEQARESAIARIELYDTLAEEATLGHQSFADWVETRLPADVEDAREKDDLDKVLTELQGVMPGLLAGAGAGYAGLGLRELSDRYRKEAREFRRRSRVSGDPRVRGQAGTRSGRAHLDDLMGRSRWLGRFARFLGGPVGIGLDVFFGVREGMETGDWTRVALTTGTSIAVGAGAAALVAAGVVTAPAWVVVGGTALVAAGVSYGVGWVYDNWDGITDWAGDRWQDTQDFASDTWEGAKDLAGDAWEAVTPW